MPGVAFAEWGPGDMGFWLVGPPQRGVSSTAQPQMAAARERVFRATLEAGRFFLNACNDDNVTDMIDEGVMICTGGYRVGREYTGRSMP